MACQLILSDKTLYFQHSTITTAIQYHIVMASMQIWDIPHLVLCRLSHQVITHHHTRHRIIPRSHSQTIRHKPQILPSLNHWILSNQLLLLTTKVMNIVSWLVDGLIDNVLSNLKSQSNCPLIYAFGDCKHQFSISFLLYIFFLLSCFCCLWFCWCFLLSFFLF